MLSHLPRALGHLLDGIRPGLEKTLYHGAALADVDPSIGVTSPAFADGDALPVRFTADGVGTAPPLDWVGVPLSAAAIIIVVEDADSPTPAPLVHAIVTGLPGTDGALAEGVAPTADGVMVLGRNSFLAPAWLPPDPPPGHGVHHYAFQVFALGSVPDLGAHPGRGTIERALADHAVAKGVLIGTYAR